MMGHFPAGFSRCVFLSIMNPSMYKILLVDRCHFSRTGLESWLNHSEDFAAPFHVTATDHLLRARELLLQWQPNMVIADLHGFMGDVHHVNQFSSIFAACGNTTRLILLQSGESDVLDDYCSQQITWRIVNKAIELRDLGQLISKALMSRPPFGEPKSITPLLTLREERILEWWGVGMSNEEIARKMEIAVKTVYTYKRNIRMKLGADNRFSLFVPLPEMDAR